MLGKDDNMLEELRQMAGSGGPAGALANELISIRDSFERGDLNAEEYQYLLNEVAQIKAQQELAADEIALRYIVSAATLLASAV